ncbi:hypothetical protein ACUTRI_09620 [Serratia sp. TSA_130.2]|uniref:hypothetical protein n=1 Tax=unclassified Serratia (in: enterobacteria) TaxID=2647522 RepID=UPI0040454035
MDNKLSELSKPVAWILGTPACKHLTTDEEYANWYVEKMSTALPLYSQEYVSALDKVAKFWIGESAGWKKRAEDAEKRIAELEAEGKVWESAALKHLERAEEAEKRLATPVRLPDVRQSSSGDRYQWSDGVHNYRLDVISMLLGAGLTVAVEGDEQ